MNPLEEKTELEEKIEQEQKREKKKFWKGVLCGAAVTLCLAVGVGIFCTAIVSGIHIFSSSEKKQVENKLQIIQAISLVKTCSLLLVGYYSSKALWNN